MPTWESTRLTTAEADAALVAAGISLDPASWSQADVDRASAALNAAGVAKVARLLEVPNPC